MISMMRINGLYAGTTQGKDPKLNLDFNKITMMFEDGKKHSFKCYGPIEGFDKLNFGAVIVVDVDTPNLRTFGEMASRGDCSWNCSGLKCLGLDKSTGAAAPQKQAA